MGVSTMPLTLRQMREKLGWTREDLFMHAGGAVSLGTIANIESGRSPTKAVRKVIADAIGVTVDEIDWPQKDRDA